MTGLEGGGDCGRNRFAGELIDYNKVCRKLNSPVGCSPGRAAKGASPVIRTKAAGEAVASPAALV